MVFTGIITSVSNANWYPSTSILEVEVDEEYWKKSEAGDSVAVNGCCLTLIEKPPGKVGRFFIMEESLKKTVFGLWGRTNPDQHSTWVNVEHAMREGDSYGGHRVSGHVSGVGYIRSIVLQKDGSRTVTIDIKSIDPLLKNVRYKGSIAVDGASLTVSDVSVANSTFNLSIIPHTWANTTLSYKSEGDYVDIEFDQDQGLSLKYSDEEWMRMAMLEGEKGRYTAAPNVWVGAVVVSADGRLLGVGHHHKAGGPHAEVVAIRNAIAKGYGDLVPGSTVYCTLEPCSHTGRTPPCANFLLEHKVGKVFVGVVDPDSRVSGTGIKLLEENGVKVVTGILSAEVAESLKAYLHSRRTGKPLVVCKVAASVDGKVSCADRTSKWITSEEARGRVQELRASSQTIITGAKTVIDDDPQMDVRAESIVSDKDFVQPEKVIIANSNKSMLDGYKIFNGSKVTQFYSDGLDLSVLVDRLAKKGDLQVMIEAGPKTVSKFLEANLIDRLILHLGPVIIGSTGRSWAECKVTETMADVKRWKLVSTKTLGDTVELTYDKE